MIMASWPRLLSMIFYAPLRGMREVRDRGSLAPMAFLALIVNGVFIFFLGWFYPTSIFNARRPLGAFVAIVQSAGLLLCIAVIFIPLMVFVMNLFERRASFRLLIQQEYSTVAATVFYGWAASGLISFLLLLAGRFSGVLQAIGSRMFQTVMQQQSEPSSGIFPPPDPKLLSPEIFSITVAIIVLLAVFAVWATLAVQVVFKGSWLRAAGVVLGCGIVSFPISSFLQPIISTLFGSPFLLLILFFLLRGYWSEVSRTQRGRIAFKQNLEAATLNPADASAHYNLGLIHQQRGELDQARERFERAVHIDADEVDAHYQLGRIARAQNRWSDAIGHFEQVVARDRTHAQHEIWREIGATYIAAGQFEDAREAMERFLDNRQMDPEGLYMMGRAHAGLGHRREATSSMQACIEAVKTAPAYKYRTEKRWLNEAQQFLKGSRQEAVSGKQ